MGGRGIVLVVLLATTVTGCGEAASDISASDTPAPPAASPTAMLPADGPVRAQATVLDDGTGPMLCLGGILTSLPPQCSGPAVAQWSWNDHPDHDAAGGVRWGDYTMVGTWDGTTFTPTDVRPTTPDDWTQVDTGALFATRCEQPEGGWVPVEPALTTDAALSSAHRVAEALPDYAISWGDQSINPRWQDSRELDGGEGSLAIEQAMNDPAYTILNVAVTEDVARAEAAVREVWGGALCVTEFVHTQQHLRGVAQEIKELPGILGSGYGIANAVEISVVHDDGSIQAWADEEYGAGVVEVTSALTPME